MTDHIVQRTDGQLSVRQVEETVRSLSPFFDIVRVVDAQHTFVLPTDGTPICNLHECFAVWGKPTRCNNCISYAAWKNHDRRSKLEYSKDGLYFVISQYVPYGESGAVIEMVTKLDNAYVDNVLDKNLLYINLDDINRQLDCDELTGVYNRRYLDLHLPDYLLTAELQKQNLALAMVDIDGFKRMNDTYGHLAGDEVLKAVAGLLHRQLATEKGDFVSRFGGDEFVLVFRDAGTALRERLQDILRIVSQTAVGEHGVKVTLSMGGVSLAEMPHATAAALLDEADRRLYRAKDAGRGTTVTD